MINNTKAPLPLLPAQESLAALQFLYIHRLKRFSSLPSQIPICGMPAYGRVVRLERRFGKCFAIAGREAIQKLEGGKIDDS
jgi:hypothetical protein